MPAPVENFYATGQDHKYSPAVLFADTNKLIPNDATLISLGIVGNTAAQRAVNFEHYRATTSRYATATDSELNGLTDIVNGDFQFTGDEFSPAPVLPQPWSQWLGGYLATNLVPGWSDHGGGGTGHVIVDPSSSNNYVLQLNANGAQRTHNLFYIPDNSGLFSFDIKKQLRSPLTTSCKFS